MLQESYELVKGQVAPCGLRCEECDLGNGDVAEAAMKLVTYIRSYDVAKWADQIPGGDDIDFHRLDQNLIWIGGAVRCPGCLKGGGNPECPIRACAKERRLASCASCHELKTCTKFRWLGKTGERLKQKLAERDLDGKLS
jgi:hypothetical protein